MTPSNFDRMLELVDEVFSTRHDPSQLQVNEDVLHRLQKIHPATLSEENNNGPVAWILIIPTTEKIMNEFLNGKISEQELFDKTFPGEKYEAIYLCSATVLPEHRKKGLALMHTLRAINEIRKDHPVKFLFVWPFTNEGKLLAEKIAERTNLELKIKEAVE
ncbi:MAG: hypothetical protein HY064_03565 [Bacteroidetes bacterium]|nr:hypothetical protein [Bacteroidota bacterium]